MKKTRRKNITRVSAADDETDRQLYFRSLSHRPTGSDANATFMELIGAIDRKAGAALDFVNCPPNPPGGFPGVTSHRFYYLSEIVAPDFVNNPTACGAALACFLSQIVAQQVNPDDNHPQVHSNATLIVDRVCVLNNTLTLPNRFTLAGVGPDGEGQLVFDLPENTSAIRFTPTDHATIRMSTIRDLRISGSSDGGHGIIVSNSQFVYIDRVRISGFTFGIYGETAYSIYIANSNIHNNAYSVVMGKDTTAWRVRDSIMSGGLVGAVLMDTARGHVISGARIESNEVTGVLVGGHMNVLETSWFEGNGSGPTPPGIRITESAEKTRVLANLFSSQLIEDGGKETKLCFNMSFETNSHDVNQFRCR